MISEILLNPVNVSFKNLEDLINNQYGEIINDYKNHIEKLEIENSNLKDELNSYKNKFLFRLFNKN